MAKPVGRAETLKTCLDRLASKAVLCKTVRTDEEYGYLHRINTMMC